MKIEVFKVGKRFKSGYHVVVLCLKDEATIPSTPSSQSVCLCVLVCACIQLFLIAWTFGPCDGSQHYITFFLILININSILLRFYIGYGYQGNDIMLATLLLANFVAASFFEIFLKSLFSTSNQHAALLTAL
jgi:hypothetical protein